MCIHYSTLAQIRRVHVSLTLEVIRGHWRPRNANQGHALTSRARVDFFMYTHMTLGNIFGYVRLTSEAIKGH